MSSIISFPYLNSCLEAGKYMLFDLENNIFVYVITAVSYKACKTKYLHFEFENLSLFFFCHNNLTLYFE